MRFRTTQVLLLGPRKGREVRTRLSLFFSSFLCRHIQHILMGMFFTCVFMNVVYYLLIPFFLCYLLHFLLVCLIIYAFFVCVCLLHSKTMSYTKPVRYI